MFFPLILALPQDDKIVGGEEVNPPFKYNFLVSIQNEKGQQCGGILVKNDTIVTAAHCSKPKSFEAFTVNAHRHDLRLKPQEENGIVFTVDKVIVHPKYNQFNFKNDVAVWKLKYKSGDASFLGSIDPVLFDDGSNAKVGNVFTVAGWGATRGGGPLSPVLRDVRVPVIKQEDCQEAYPDLDDSSICAGYPNGGKDACQGDSGGPMFEMRNSSVLLIGLTSYGKGCAREDYPGVYTRIGYPQVRQFILDNI
jgi:secreted trypsin-like serine protease